MWHGSYVSPSVQDQYTKYSSSGSSSSAPKFKSIIFASNTNSWWTSTVLDPPIILILTAERSIVKVYSAETVTSLREASTLNVKSVAAWSTRANVYGSNTIVNESVSKYELYSYTSPGWLIVSSISEPSSSVPSHERAPVYILNLAF